MRASKDAAIAVALRGFLNRRLSAIGEVAELLLDTSARSARVRVALHGEPEPVDLYVRKYALDADQDADWLTLVDVTASREWLGASLRQFVVGRPIRLPRTAAKALRLLA